MESKGEVGSTPSVERVVQSTLAHMLDAGSGSSFTLPPAVLDMVLEVGVYQKAQPLSKGLCPYGGANSGILQERKHTPPPSTTAGGERKHITCLKSALCHYFSGGTLSLSDVLHKLGVARWADEIFLGSKHRFHECTCYCASPHCFGVLLSVTYQ